MQLAPPVVMHSRLLFFSLLLGFFVLTGARGEPARALRIGLRTKQPQVCLQGSVPLCVEHNGASIAEIPVDQPVSFVAHDHGMTVHDATGATLLDTDDPVQVMPAPPATNTVATLLPTAPCPPPLIRMLGPTRHYDGKPDRPYRGGFDIMPTPDGLTVVNIVPLEPYLYGVVSSEMGPRFPLEALKAQAIAARTYALKHLGRFARLGYDLDDTTLCQVYGGYFSEDPKTMQAVDDTAGTVLTYHGQLIDAMYSSNSGGFTESAESALGRNVPYLVSMPDQLDNQTSPLTRPTNEQAWADFFKSVPPLAGLQPKFARVESFRWVKMVTRQELQANLPATAAIGIIQNVLLLHRGDSGRLTSVRIEGTTGNVLLDSDTAVRRAFGEPRSSAFTVDTYRDDSGTPVVFALWGGGWGHGIGMCQVGAGGLADQGWSYDKILAHYYPGTQLVCR